jgi:hypothetical protein
MGRVVHSNFIVIRGIPRFKFEGRQVVCMYFKLQCFKIFFFVCLRSRFVFEFILVIAIFIVFYTALQRSSDVCKSLKK